MAVGFCISSDAQSVISVQKQNTREKKLSYTNASTSRNVQHTHTAPLVSSLKITIPIQCSDVDSASLRLPHHVVAETNWIYPASAMGTGQSISSINYQYILSNLISLCQLVINQTHFRVGNPFSIIAWCINWRQVRRDFHNVSFIFFAICTYQWDKYPRMNLL